MTTHFLYELPLWLLNLSIVGISMGFGIAGVWLVRRAGWMQDADNNDTATLAHAFIGVLYAVALGLMVVGVQGSYSEVETTVMKEANFAGDLYFDLAGIDGPKRSEYQSQAKRYIEAVIEDEWPAIAKGEASEETEKIIENLARQIITYRPASDRDQVVFAEVLRGVNELLNERRERLFLGTSGVGGVTWSIVLIGAAITIGVACFYSTPSARVHYVLVAMMSAMFGLMIFLIISMDHPLWGQFSVQPDAFRKVLEEIQQWDAASP
jgi:hypothetical protein